MGNVFTFLQSNFNGSVVFLIWISWGKCTKIIHCVGVHSEKSLVHLLVC